MSDLTLNGWVPKRRGVLRHLYEGRMTLYEYVVFDILLLMADHKTGCGMINAPALANYWLGGQISPQAAKIALQGLEKKGYIVRETVPGRLGLYVFKVQNYEVVYYDQQGKPRSKHLRFVKKSDKVEEIDTLLEDFGAKDVQHSEQETLPQIVLEPLPQGVLDTHQHTLHDTTSNKEQEQVTKDNDLSSDFSPVAGEPGLRMAQRYNSEAPEPVTVPTRDIPVEVVMNLVDQFADKSKHWKFRQKDSRADCTKAFTKLLGENGNTEEEVSDVIDYAAKHPMYGTAMRTISKKEDNPWVWFVKTYDEIRAHMHDDVDHVKRVVERTAAKKEAISKGLESVAGPMKPKDQNLPQYRKDSGKREILKSDI